MKRKQNIKKRLLAGLLTLCLLLGLLPSAALAAGGTPPDLSGWQTNDGTKVAAYVYTGTGEPTDANCSDAPLVYIPQGRIESQTVPTLGGYLYKDAVVLHHDGLTTHIHSCSYAFLNRGETYWHYYNEYEQTDNQVGVKLETGDKIILRYEETTEFPVEVTVVDSAGDPEHRVISAPSSVEGNEKFTIQVATSRGYKPVVTAGKDQASQTDQYVSLVPGTDGVYEIDTSAMHASGNDIIYVTVAYRPIGTIQVEMDAGASWQDFNIISSEYDPAHLPEADNTFTKYMFSYAAAPTFLAFSGQVLGTASYTLNVGTGNTVYLAILTNNSVSSGKALTNLEINGTPLNLPEVYGAYENPGTVDSALIGEGRRTAYTTLPSGTEVTVTLEDSPHMVPGDRPNMPPSLTSQYAYLVTLTDVYEDIRVTSGHFLSTGAADGQGKEYALLPRTLKGVEMQYSFNRTDWLPAAQGRPIDQTNESTVYLRYKMKTGYYNPAASLKAVHIGNSTYTPLSITPEPDGEWYTLVVPRYVDGDYTYSYQMLDITSEKVAHRLFYLNGDGSVAVNGQLPTDPINYHVDGTSTVHISNQIPVSTDSDKVFRSWRAYRNGDTSSETYLELYPGDTIPVEELFAYEAGHGGSGTEHHINLYAQWGTLSNTEHNLHSYSIKVFRQCENGTGQLAGNGKYYEELSQRYLQRTLASTSRLNPSGVTVSFLNPAEWGVQVAALRDYHYNAVISNASVEVTNDNNSAIKLYFDEPLTLTYHPNGATGGTSVTESYPSGTVVTPKENASALFAGGTLPAGYTFRGWSTSQNGGILTETSLTVTDDVTLYAIWTRPTEQPIHVKYYRNAGDSTTYQDPITYTMDSTVTVGAMSEGFTAPAGKLFDGWNTAADGTGTSYQPGASFVISALPGDLTIHLYAQWKDGLTVTYNANGGSGAHTDEGLYRQGDSVTLWGGNDFTKENYILTSWNTQANGNGRAYPLSGSFVMPNASMTLYAQWTEKHTVTFHGNGSAEHPVSGSTDKQEAAHGSSISLTENRFVRRGTDATGAYYEYQFTGWNTAADGSGTAYSNRHTLVLNEDLTLYAQWTRLYTVNYYDLGADGNGWIDGFTDINRYTGGQRFPVFAYNSTLEGYTFTGWGTTPTGGADANYMPGQLSVQGITGDVDLYAQWERNSSSEDNGGSTGGGSSTTRYTLHYESNGGTQYPDERYSENTIARLDKAPIRSGYTFTGWYSDPELTDPVSQLQMNRNRTVYAGWRASSAPTMLNGAEHFAYVFGYPDGTMGVLKNISRAETAAIFFRLLKDDVRNAYLTDVNTFADVTEGMWFNTAISTLSALDVIKGRSQDIFDPNASITRAEFAAICARFDTTAQIGGGSFTDISDHWAEESIKQAAALGWISGYADGTFRPNEPITRAEAITMINRVLCRVPESEEDLLEGVKTWPDCSPNDWYYLSIQEAANSHEYKQKGEINETWTALKDYEMQ